MALIRLETPADIPAIRELMEAAFPGDAEADLVDRLREDGDIVLSLVAESDEFVIGHVLFSRIVVESERRRSHAVALAPLAVYTEYQQQGIATRLMRDAHACLAAMGERLSIVLGEPHFYSRFGYSHRRAAGFTSTYQSPYLMALSFGEAPWEGRLVYPPAFSALSEHVPTEAHDRV